MFFWKFRRSEFPVSFWNYLAFRQQQCLIYEPLCFKLRHYFLVQLQMKTIYRGGRERQAYLQWVQSLSEVAFGLFLQLFQSIWFTKADMVGPENQLLNQLFYQSLASLLLINYFLQFVLFLDWAGQQLPPKKNALSKGIPTHSACAANLNASRQFHISQWFKCYYSRQSKWAQHNSWLNSLPKVTLDNKFWLEIVLSFHFLHKSFRHFFRHFFINFQKNHMNFFTSIWTYGLFQY